MTKITPFLWFNNNAEEAIKFYASVFKNSKIVSIDRYPNEEDLEGPMKGFGGKVLNGEFELDGQKFMAIDGGPVWEFSGATSFVVNCKDQQEVDYYWGKLSAVPEAERCGWCKDKFGVTWQIIPKQLGELMSDSDSEKVKRVTRAMLQMKKIVVADLESAYKEK
ncbi:VOC family protein [Candidatus Saccharibacteria bacterium]|nr:VOC family protein [Candidatus Saccharibacteria bacterium]